MKWKIKKPEQVGNPLRSKDWLRFSEVIRAAQNDIAYNHQGSCEKADDDIEALACAYAVAVHYAQPPERKL
jgi:predicted RNase H-like nuclease